MLGRYVGREIDRHGARYALAKVRPLLEEADIVFGNLECPITNRAPALRKPFLFGAPKSRLRALKLKERLVLTLANNHTLDCGREGLADTEAALEEAGIRFCGAGKNESEAWKPAYIDVKGSKLAFIGFSDFPQHRHGKGADEALYDVRLMRAAVGEARRNANVVIVAPHWGVEGTAEVSERQKQEAASIAAAGADLILGSHPHVVQPIAWLPGPAGRKCLVVYSLGNFIFDATKPAERETEIVQAQMGPHGVYKAKAVRYTIWYGRPEIPFPAGRSSSEGK